MANSLELYNKALDFAKKQNLPVDKGEIVFDGNFQNGAAFFFQADPVVDKDGVIINPPQTGYPTYIFTDGKECRFMNSIEISNLWSMQ